MLFRPTAFLTTVTFSLLMVSCALADVALRGYDAKSGYVYVTLGQCPQDADGGVEPIIWRVLSVEDGRAYLLSEYVLEARPIHSDYQEYANKPTNKKKPGFNGDFTQTEMSRYLCGDFARFKLRSAKLFHSFSNRFRGKRSSPCLLGN